MGPHEKTLIDSNDYFEWFISNFLTDNPCEGCIFTALYYGDFKYLLKYRLVPSLREFQYFLQHRYDTLLSADVTDPINDDYLDFLLFFELEVYKEFTAMARNSLIDVSDSRMASYFHYFVEKILEQLEKHLQRVLEYGDKSVTTKYLKIFCCNSSMRSLVLHALEDKIKTFAQPKNRTQVQEMESVLASFFEVFTDEEIARYVVYGAKNYVRTQKYLKDFSFMEPLKPYFSEEAWTFIQKQFNMQ
jgi:hypothetical protein